MEAWTLDAWTQNLRTVDASTLNAWTLDPWTQKILSIFSDIFIIIIN